LGNLYRRRKCFCTHAVKVFDHDYEHLSQGKVIPHGIYDIRANQGYVSIGGRSETADFILDNLLWWWWEYGINQYPHAENILLLCDAGGANSYRHFIFKHRLMDLPNKQDCPLWYAIIHPIIPNETPLDTACSAMFTRLWKGLFLLIMKPSKLLSNKHQQKLGLL